MCRLVLLCVDTRRRCEGDGEEAFIVVRATQGWAWVVVNPQVWEGNKKLVEMLDVVGI